MSAHKQDARICFDCGEYKLPEILVFREENSPVVFSQSDDLEVARTAQRTFRDRDYVMTRRAQRPYDRKIAALVGEKPHRL